MAREPLDIYILNHLCFVPFQSENRMSYTVSAGCITSACCAAKSGELRRPELRGYALQACRCTNLPTAFENIGDISTFNATVSQYFDAYVKI